MLDAAARATAQAVAAARGVTLLVNDPQRGTATGEVLRRIQPTLRGKRLRVIVATGSHHFGPEQRADFEQSLLAGLKVSAVAWHDARATDLCPIGPAGAVWHAHPWLLEDEDLLLAVGSCEPHYFAGITGAHKTVTIGCASYGDIEANHRHALSPASRPGRLEGNPVHDGVAAMLAALESRRPVLAVNLMQLGDTVLAAASGRPMEALEALAEPVRQTYFCRLAAPADALVLEVDGPLGVSFYQADKGIKNSEWAVRDGGALVLVAACPEGIGQSAFTRLLRDCPSFASISERVERQGYRLGDHKAVKLRYLTDARRVRVFVVSDGLSSDDAALLGFAKAPAALAALAAAGVRPGRDQVYRVRDAGNTCVAIDH